MSHPVKSNEFPRILLKSIFSFMICDGRMSAEELKFLRSSASSDQIFEGLNVENEIDDMVDLVNLKGVDFLKDYFKKVNHIALSLEQELLILKSALNTIQYNRNILQGEINFLRILRTELNVSDDVLLDHFPDIALHFVKKDDLTAAYIKEIYDNYFHERELPTIDIDDVKDISDSIDLTSKKS